MIDCQVKLFIYIEIHQPSEINITNGTYTFKTIKLLANNK